MQHVEEEGSNLKVLPTNSEMKVEHILRRKKVDDGGKKMETGVATLDVEEDT